MLNLLVMPTYHYRCKSCEHEFEEFQKMSDEVLKFCPKCKKHSLVRIIGGGAGVVFKGSGFYITDYKNKPKLTDKKDQKSEKKSLPKSDTQSDAKSTG
jgi:putative FmdB family regulatory protein